MRVCLYQKSVCKVYRTEGVYCRFIQYVSISVFAKTLPIKDSASENLRKFGAFSGVLRDRNKGRLLQKC